MAGVDLTVNAGDVYGYLGPNGAGKTTSLRMMLGLIRPTEGTVRLFGRDPLQSVHALDDIAGFVEAPTFYPYLTGRRNLELLGSFDGGDARDRIEPALETVELSDRAKDRVGGYSHGMRQRLGIAAALLRNPKLLLLDEPATGLDPAGMRDMRLLIRRLADQGMTVMLSSHLLAEVEELCNRVAIVRSGKIVYEGAIADLKRTAGATYWLSTTDDERALAVCGAQPGIEEVRTAHGRIAFTADDAAVAELSQALIEAGALLRNPKLLLLDEPATGLDPAGMRDMRLLIRRLADQGMTVMLSSHLLAEVEELCNRVAIVRSGKIVYEGAIADLKRTAGATYWLSTTDDERALAVCRAQPGIEEVRTAHGRIAFTADDAAVAELSQALIEAGALIQMLTPQTVTLEDLFFSLTEGDGVVPAPAPPVVAR